MADEEKEEQVEYPLNLSQLYDLEEYATSCKSSVYSRSSNAISELDLDPAGPEAAKIFERGNTVTTLAEYLPYILQDKKIPYETRLEKIDIYRRHLNEVDRELDAYIRQLRRAQESKDES